MPVADIFWGDRYGKLSDPFGHKWSIATHTRDVTMEEMEEAQKEFAKQIPKSAAPNFGDRLMPASRKRA
jgi:transposase